MDPAWPRDPFHCQTQAGNARLPSRRHGTATVPPSALGSNYTFQFLLLTFHLPVSDGVEEGCPLRGSPGPHTGRPPMHSTSKGLPSARPLHSLPMLCSPLPPLPHSVALVSLGPRSRGSRGQARGPGNGVGGRERRCSVTSRRCPLGGVQRKGERCLAGTFLSFISRFFCI